MKKIAAAIACLVLGSVFLALGLFQIYREQQTLADGLIRFHVIANSNSGEDQSVKLAVRDALLSFMGGNEWESREEAEGWIRDNLTLLEHEAQTVLTEKGMSYDAGATLHIEAYPTRDYETFSLPAGDYLSLKITLGKGEGRNWWCVAYPNFCMASAGKIQLKPEQVLSQGEMALICERSPGVRFKFKLLEWIQFVRKFLQDT